MNVFASQNIVTPHWQLHASANYTGVLVYISKSLVLVLGRPLQHAMQEIVVTEKKKRLGQMRGKHSKSNKREKGVRRLMENKKHLSLARLPHIRPHAMQSPPT